MSETGQPIRQWPLYGPGASVYRSATVPGGFMYVFTMEAEASPCGDAAATFTRPN